MYDYTSKERCCISVVKLYPILVNLFIYFATKQLIYKPLFPRFFIRRNLLVAFRSFFSTFTLHQKLPLQFQIQKKSVVTKSVMGVLMLLHTIFLLFCCLIFPHVNGCFHQRKIFVFKNFEFFTSWLGNRIFEILPRKGLTNSR